MRSILTIAFIILCTGSMLFAQSNKKQKKYINPFDTLKYDRVVAYDYNGSPETPIVENGKLLQNRKRIYQEKTLTKPQIDKLNKTLGEPKSYGGSTAACFDPHFGLVFYNQGKIVGHISICLGCNYLVSKPEIPAMNSHKTDLCAECYAVGFSKSARKTISDFVKELKFSHWELNSTLFDE